MDDESTVVQVFENYRSYYLFSDVGTELFEVFNGTSTENFQVSPSVAGIKEDLYVDLSPTEELAFAILSEPVDLTDFEFKMNVQFIPTEESGVLLGSSTLDGEGYLSYSLSTSPDYYDIALKLGGQTLTLTNALRKSKNSYLVVSRLGNVVTLSVDTVVLYKGVFDNSIWRWDTLGKTFSSPFQFRSKIGNLTLSFPDLGDNYLYYPMNDLSGGFTPQIINSITGKVVENGTTVVYEVVDETGSGCLLLTDETGEGCWSTDGYVLNIENYKESYWTSPEMGYSVKIYKTLSNVDKSLIKENNLIPKTVGVPVEYEDLNGNF